MSQSLTKMKSESLQKLPAKKSKVFSDESIRRIPLTNRDEYAPDSFIAVKITIIF
jgi:hypothetical protein